MPRRRLLDQLREAIRVRHYSRSTEKAYAHWIRRFILFHDKRHPSEMGAAEVEAFLSWLATDRRVAASSQNQALSAILFLYRAVLMQELPWMDGVVRAKRPQRMPVVLSRSEVRRLLELLPGRQRLIAELLYGTGLRQIEALRLRVKDLDFHYRQITVRCGKGNKDRVTVLPDCLRSRLERHLERVRRLHQHDLASGLGEADLPFALARTTMIYTHVLKRGGRGVRSPLD